MRRPDFSDYVAHFTKDSSPLGDRGEPQGIVGTAKERLVSILETQTVRATRMPWTNKPAAAFTECPWWSLLGHAAQYSPYGVGFRKETLFAAGGGPALYLRPDVHAKQQEFVLEARPDIRGFHRDVYAFVTLFCPRYAPEDIRQTYPDHCDVDYSHEREWRVPHDFRFDLADVAFVIVDTYEDVAQFPRGLKDAIGRKKFLIMDVYRKIEELWPTHVMGG